MIIHFVMVNSSVMVKNVFQIFKGSRARIVNFLFEEKGKDRRLAERNDMINIETHSRKIASDIF